MKVARSVRQNEIRQQTGLTDETDALLGVAGGAVGKKLAEAGRADWFYR